MKDKTRNNNTASTPNEATEAAPINSIPLNGTAPNEPAPDTPQIDRAEDEVNTEQLPLVFTPEPDNEQSLHLPKFSIILFIMAGVSILVWVAAVISTPFADFFSRYPGAFIRAVTSYLTSWIPFSFAECVLLFTPVAIFFVLRLAVKKYSSTWRNTAVYIGILFSFASLFLSIFVLGFGTGYHGSTVDKKLGLDRQDVSTEDLYNTAVILAAKVNEESENVSFRPENFSVMPYSLEQMNKKLLAAFKEVSEEHHFIQKLTSRIKPVMLSEAMSYTHITGVYTYFTGEANLNMAFPDYTLPYTAAHELAHQRGIAREDEANFIAFLVCIASDDPYIRYSGYLNLYEFVASALFSADADLYFKMLNGINSDIRYEMIAYSKFYQKYKNSKVASVSQAINDTYLKIQGTEGTKSYGMVTDLAVAYYKSK